MTQPSPPGQTDGPSQAVLTSTASGLDVEFLSANGQVVGPLTLLAVPAGASIADPEATQLSGGGYVVTWLAAESHAVAGDYAVFNAQGALLGNQSVGAYTTGLEAIAAPDGGFALARAQSDLFGQHASLTLQLMSAAGAPESAPVVVESVSSPDGGLYLQDLEGAYGRGHLGLTWQDLNGQQSALLDVGAHDRFSASAFALTSHPHSDWFM